MLGAQPVLSKQTLIFAKKAYQKTRCLYRGAACTPLLLTTVQTNRSRSSCHRSWSVIVFSEPRPFFSTRTPPYKNAHGLVACTTKQQPLRALGHDESAVPVLEILKIKKPRMMELSTGRLQQRLVKSKPAVPLARSCYLCRTRAGHCSTAGPRQSRKTPRRRTACSSTRSCDAQPAATGDSYHVFPPSSWLQKANKNQRRIASQGGNLYHKQLRTV